MHEIGFFSLLLALFCSFGLAGLGCYQAWTGTAGNSRLMERGQIFCTAAILVTSSVLLYALATRDFSFAYVRDYTDTFLPQFYALTAFWAGQDGSFLFWVLCIALFGVFVIFSPGYRKLSPEVQRYFWVFFFLIQGFFLVMLTGPSNPCIELVPAAAEGRGLNPLLQNPGMIFHPPLLFLGYAGFTVPFCLALAIRLAGDNKSWLDASVNWVLVSWIFLTAGIVLGAWWSYMELGWGGYWAWDPVENASLIPWLSATAFLHTSIISRRRGALYRSNFFLVGLTFLLCIFGTFVVRSGIIDSLHAFGGSEVGMPLLWFMLVGLGLSLYLTFKSHDGESTHLDELWSKPGLLMIAGWILLGVGLIVFLGVNWPVISKLWSDKAIGLDAGFYNRVCLPLFALLALLLSICPWMQWKEGVRSLPALGAVIGTGVAAAIVFGMKGITHPVALLGAASACMAMVSIVLLFVIRKDVRSRRYAWGAYGVHIGVAMMVLGVAFSGPYQIVEEAVLEKGHAMTAGAYTLTYDHFREDHTPAMETYEARLLVTRDGADIGVLTPQKRMYRNFSQTFAEVSVIPSLGEEVYATLLGFNEDHDISVKISINPLVNWIWIGGTLMSLAAFLCWRTGRRKG